MSEVALLSFGCAVSFIVAGAVYVFATEDFAGSERSRKQEARIADAEKRDVSKAA